MQRGIVECCRRFILLCLLGCMTAVAQTAPKVGDYVEFGSYQNAPILWRVMAVDGQNATLWSEYVLTAKCFDASESGVAGKGSNQAEQWGSNVWNNSNIREWLNASGKVNWSTQKPTLAAIQGGNNYENEPGFLTGFTEAERERIVPTERSIVGYYFHRQSETTQDMVFLPSYEEVKNGGEWNLTDESRKKRPSKTAAASFRAMALLLRKGFGYQYYLQTLDDYDKSTVRAVTFEGQNSDQYSANHSSVGIAPVIQIKTGQRKSGDGSQESPWRF